MARLVAMLEAGLVDVCAMTRPERRTADRGQPPFTYTGSDPSVHKAYEVIRRLRRHADTVTIFETDVVPYWLALLEWTLPVVIYVQISDWHKKYAAYSAGLLCEAIMRLELSR